MSARSVSRRDAAAGGIAALILGAAADGQAKAAELDGELLALCQEFHDLQAKMDAADEAAEDSRTGSPAHRLWEATIRPLVDRSHDVRFEIAELAARTPEGLQAKARVVMADLADGADPKFLSYDPQQALGHSLARDIVEGAGR